MKILKICLLCLAFLLGAKSEGQIEQQNDPFRQDFNDNSRTLGEDLRPPNNIEEPSRADINDQPSKSHLNRMRSPSSESRFRRDNVNNPRKDYVGQRPDVTERNRREREDRNQPAHFIDKKAAGRENLERTEHSHFDPDSRITRRENTEREQSSRVGERPNGDSKRQNEDTFRRPNSNEQVPQERSGKFERNGRIQREKMEDTERQNLRRSNGKRPNRENSRHTQGDEYRRNQNPRSSLETLVSSERPRFQAVDLNEDYSRRPEERPQAHNSQNFKASDVSKSDGSDKRFCGNSENIACQESREDLRTFGGDKKERFEEKEDQRKSVNHGARPFQGRYLSRSEVNEERLKHQV